VTEPTTTDTAPDTAAVANLLQVFTKGLRAIQLYLPNNPVFQKSIDNVRSAFEPVWQECAELDLEVTETDFVWDGAVVLSQPKADSVAWVLYKDGVRSLTLMPGVEDEEIVRFLHVVNKARHLPPESNDDLLTLLWEENLETIKYDYVDLTAVDQHPITASEAEPQTASEAVRKEVQEEAEAERPPGLVDIEEFDSTLYFLDPREIKYLRNEVEREYGQNLRGNILSMLFDLLELQAYATVRAELISIVENFIPYLLAAGDFQAVAFVLREIRAVKERARELLDEHRTKLEELPAKLSQSESLAQLLQSLDEAHVHPTEEELGDLFRELRPEALETLLQWLPKLTNQRVRELLGSSARRLAAAHPHRLAAAIESDDEAVALEAIGVVSYVKLPPVVPALGGALTREIPAIRQAAVLALASMGSPGALQQLEAAIDDDDRDVRVAAVRAFADRGYRGGFAKIESAVIGGTLRQSDLTEKTAFFEAYGTLAGAAGIARLHSMLRTKGFMKRKEDPETRACAAMALGKIGTPEAREILTAVVNDKDPLVRNAVNQALRDMK
jgi:hypothetical protein